MNQYVASAARSKTARIDEVNRPALNDPLPVALQERPDRPKAGLQVTHLPRALRWPQLESRQERSLMTNSPSPPGKSTHSSILAATVDERLNTESPMTPGVGGYANGNLPPRQSGGGSVHGTGDALMVVSTAHIGFRARVIIVKLHAREWGHGERLAILLHGMMGSSGSWHRVGPVLAARGYRVIAFDLPGHGRSPRDAHLSIDGVVAAVIETAHHYSAKAPMLAVGHSYGGTVLAAARNQLQPETTVVVDAPTSARGGRDRDEAAARYAREARERSFDWLRATRPYYSEEDARIEAEAAKLFDPATAAAVSSAAGGSWPLPPGSVLIRPEPSLYVSDETAARLEASGVIVRGIAGAAHTVWYSHFDEFITALPGRSS